VPEATIDHIVSLIALLGAILIFIGLFNQTIQTAVVYEEHAYLATECSDLLDSILLNPGSPSNTTLYWGTSNCTPTNFGLQDPEFTQYELSPFSLMRLFYSPGSSVYYDKTNAYYSNNTLTLGESLLTPYNEVVNYTTVTQLLGINGTLGFSLALTPLVSVITTQTQSTNLSLTVTVTSNGYPLANAGLSYCLIAVSGQGSYPSFTIEPGTNTTNSQGQALLSFPDVDGTKEPYALMVVCASQSGLLGTGDYEHALNNESYAIPLIADFGNQSVLIANSQDVYLQNNPSSMSYNATFFLLTHGFTLSQMPLTNPAGNIDSGPGTSYGNITIPTNNPGILAIGYNVTNPDNTVSTGVTLMPWGISPMPLPVVLGGNPLQSDWVTEDIRQVTVNGISYQAKLELWSLQGYTEISQK